MTKTNWAVLGTGAICTNFVDALTRSEHGVLHAIGSSTAARATEFASAHGAPNADDYAGVIARTDVDAVYIGTVHTTHAELAIQALEAGKAVLCEKPMAISSTQTEIVIEAAHEADRPFAEAYKFRFSPFFDGLLKLLADGEIGELVSVDAAFGFKSAEHTGRLFDPALGGGALLDVGGYPISFVVAVAEACGIDLGGAQFENAGAEMTHGVEGSVHARVKAEGFIANVEASIIETQTRSVQISGTKGSIFLPDGWGSRTKSATQIVVRTDSAGEQTLEFAAHDPMAAEADSVSRALAAGRVEIDEMSWAQSIVTNHMLERWRNEAIRTD